ncbi:MAG TPA: hypothetical protein VK213_11635 [Bacteroidales bacterium]|nr:hypothetical protein [Bacteroidales bacterium]
MKTVFGKSIFSIILVFSLVAASCNTNENRKDVRVRKGNDGNEDVRVKEHRENDSVSIDREKKIRQDNDGDKTVKEDVDVDRKRR